MSFNSSQLKQKMANIIHLVRQPKKYLPRIPQRLPRGKKLWRLILRIVIVCVAVGILGSSAVFAWYYKDLPRPGELRNRPASESTILYDRTGKQIYDISGDERRILLTNKDIPDVVKHATVSIEDHNFYHHHGVDFKGLIRGTLLKPLRGQGVQGGSTITQQYVKNAILSPNRSITRKIKEIILSLEIEAVYSKDDILTLYLNEIPYGSNLYGVEAASQAYYGKSAKDGLTVSQAATLAAIPQLPTFYSPYGDHVDSLMVRKNRVIDAMVKNHYITAAEGDKAKKEAPLESKDFAQKHDNFPAPHFVMYVRQQLVDKYGEDLVQRGGLRVTTTLDLDLQKIADDTVKDIGGKVLPGVKASNSALVAIDPKTGQILSMVGSLDYFDREHEGNFNVATSKSRQPGSAGKPIVYATLLKNKGYSPAYPFWDVKTDFNGYKPNNFDGGFHGPVSMRTALGNSYNIPAVKALQLAGVSNFIDTAKDLGITTLDNRQDAGLSLALGGGEIKLVDLVAAYSVFANHGERHTMTPILKITDSKGKVLDEWKDNSKQVIAPEIAFEISHMLADPEAKKPTFGRLLNSLTVKGQDVAVKTGTTDNFKDAWTLGYTPSLAAGVWAGNNDGKEMDHGGGSTAAAPIWQAFMAKALATRPKESFFVPSSMQQMTVDFLSSKKPTSASGQLVNDWFAPWQVPTKDDDVHVSVKVCKSDGKLATDATPPEETEDRTFTHVHSEHPDIPAWEGPVQSWANDKGINTGTPPTDKCSLTFSDPKIKITSPNAGDTVIGIFTVSADVTFPPDVSGSVNFSLDGKLITTDDTAPFNATVDSANLGTGSHTIIAEAQGTNGKSASDSITVTVGADATSPGDVKNVVLTPSLPAGSAQASWTNPSDNDLNNVDVYVSQAAGIRGAQILSAKAKGGESQNAKLTGLVSGVVNYVTFITVDKHGNTNNATHQYTVTPL